MTTETPTDITPLDFKLIFYEHLKEDGIHSFDAQLLKHDPPGSPDIQITDVKIRTLTDPKKIFDWKLGKIYMLPVKKHSKLENVYMLHMKWKELVHVYMDEEAANPIIPTPKFYEQEYIKPSTDHSSVSDDKPKGKQGSEAKFSTRSEKIGEPIPKQTVQDEAGSQSLTEPFQDRFQMMDKRDEEQILAEIKGHMIEEYVYEFMVGGKKITGVSYAGVKAMVTRRGGYEIISDTIIKEDGYFLAKAKIQDKQMDLQGLGLGECAIHEPFARQKAMGKALRNAYRSIMDEGQFIAFIKDWKNRKEKS